MAFANAGGVKVFFEEAGTGTPIIFVHEFGGDSRSWDAQLAHFSRGYRCITMNARGYPPSDVPGGGDAYRQDIFNRDVIAVLDAAGVAKAHVVGLSMGAYTALQIGMHFPDRVLSLVAAGGGSGSELAARAQFQADATATAALMDQTGGIDAQTMGLSPTRVQLLVKDPKGWARFVQHVGEHSATGSARTLRGVQVQRSSLYELEAGLKGIAAPVLLIVGDEDEPCLDVNLWMKRLMPSAELALLPRTGHACNLEEPALFNQLIERFLASIDRGSWKPRDPRATSEGVFSSLRG